MPQSLSSVSEIRKPRRGSWKRRIKLRQYEKDGETKEFRELVVTAASLEKMKLREQAA